MKKVMPMIVGFLLIGLFLLAGCSHIDDSHEVYEIDTELGDHFSVEFYLRGNTASMYPHYIFYGENFTGSAFVHNRSLTEKPDDPLEDFSTIGAYGNTHFYELHDIIIYVYGGHIG